MTHGSFHDKTLICSTLKAAPLKLICLSIIGPPHYYLLNDSGSHSKEFRIGLGIPSCLPADASGDFSVVSRIVVREMICPQGVVICQLVGIAVKL